MGLKCHTPEGAFYVFPSIKSAGISSMDFSNRLLKVEKVAVVPGTAFGPSGEGYIRISYAYSMDSLKEAIGRIKSFLKTV
jgi:aminotransferase